MMLRAAVAALMLSLLMPSALVAGINPVQATLDNGLTVVVTESHAAPVVAVRFYVKTGSIYEDRLLGYGLSHYLEHTLSKGTPTRDQEEIDSTIEAIGNASNAYTSRDHCCYYITTASQYWQTALDVVGDYVFNATFPEEEVDIQKGVILREIAMTEDDPSNRIYWDFSQTMFHVHPARYPIIGFADRFRELTRDDIVAYHRAWYVPDNTILSIAGDVDAREAVAECRELFESVPRRPPPAIVLPEEPPQTAPRRRVDVDERLQRAYLYLGYRTIDLLHPDLYPLDVLAYILGHGASSRLVRVVREETQLVDGISCYSHTPTYDAGVFGVSATLDPEKLAEAEEATVAELERCREELVKNHELERAKTQKAAELIRARETAEDLAEVVGMDLLATGDPLFSDHYVEGIRQVTKEDVRRVARAYVQPEKLTVAVLTPKRPRERGEGTERAATSPDITKTVLPNGLTVLVQHSSTVPTVSIATAAKGGLRFEAEEINGITQLMANMLTRGTKTRSREQLAREVEDMGAGLSPYSGRNSFGLQASALREDLDQILELVADVLMNASFPEDEFQAQQHFTLAAIKQQEDDVHTLARKLFLETFYTVHPYRFLAIGTEKSVDSLNEAQIAEYYDSYCRPNRTVLSLFGDVEPESAVAAVEKALGNWKPREVEDATPPREPALEEVRTARRERDQEQSIVCVGFPGTTVDDERNYTIEVLDAVMSGMSLPGGRLHDALRREQLVYFVHAWSEPGIDPGAFVIMAGTEPAKTDTVIDIVKGIVNDMKASPVSDEELRRGKQMCVAEHDIALQSAASRAQTAALDELYGLGYDYYKQYAPEVEKVTAADVQRVAQELLDLDRCVITVLAPASGGEQPPA
jgi:zinc protease